MQGKFIVFYGVNNLGKTTQAKMLAKERGWRMVNANHPIEKVHRDIVDIAAKTFDNFVSYE